MNEEETKFLADLDKRLWNAADRLRANVDAAVYKHVVLGLIFLKYGIKERGREYFLLRQTICLTRHDKVNPWNPDNSRRA